MARTVDFRGRITSRPFWTMIPFCSNENIKGEEMNKEMMGVKKASGCYKNIMRGKVLDPNELLYFTESIFHGAKELISYTGFIAWWREFFYLISPPTIFSVIKLLKEEDCFSPLKKEIAIDLLQEILEQEALFTLKSVDKEEAEKLAINNMFISPERAAAQYKDIKMYILPKQDVKHFTYTMIYHVFRIYTCKKEGTPVRAPVRVDDDSMKWFVDFIKQTLPPMIDDVILKLENFNSGLKNTYMDARVILDSINMLKEIKKNEEENEAKEED